MNNWNLLKNMLIEENVLSQKEAVSSVEKAVIFNVVDKLLSSTKVEKALQILDGAIKCESTDASLYQKKSQILLKEGYIENAIAVLRTAHEIDESNIDVILEVINAYIANKDFNGGMIFTNEVLEKNLNGLEVEILLAKADLLVRSGKGGDAYDLLVKMLFNYPNDAVVCKQFINVTASERLQKEAIGVLEDIIDEHPYAEYVWYALGHLYYYQCRFDEARMAYEYVFIIDPTHEQAYRHYVSVCTDTGSYKKALQAYSEMIERFVMKTEDMIKIADCYIHFKDYDRAIKFLGHAVKKDCMNPDIYYKMAQVYSSQGTYTFCLNYINKAIRLDDENETYHLLSAQILYKLGRIKESEEAFDNAVEIAPMLEDTWTSYITTQIEARDYAVAIDTLACAEIESASPIFEYLKVVCLFGLQNEKEAIQLLESCLVESFEEHGVIFDLMPALENNKTIKDMVAYYLFEQ